MTIFSSPSGISAPTGLRTVGALRDAGYRYRTVKHELREHAIKRLAAGVSLLAGVRGYEDTVEPEIAAAVLSQHDMLLMGLRGQAKTRILRGLVGLLDPWIPVIDDPAVELREDPLVPTTDSGRQVAARRGADLTIRWVPARDRYVEKLATPDVTVADLIGELDIVKYAQGRAMADESTMHFGLIPRANRGLFAINELPDLSPRIQVGLFNVLEERDVQIRGYPVRLNLDLSLCFSANPEDYTNRGRIVTPLKDRLGSVVRTHYPRGSELAMRITRENAFLERGPAASAIDAPAGEEILAAMRDPASWWKPPAAPRVEIPAIMHEILETMIGLARKSPHINQASGVSVRAAIAALENVVSSAEMRGLRTGEARVCVRVSDLAAAIPGCRGKIELMLAEDAVEGDGRSTEDKLIESLMGEAVKAALGKRLPVARVEPVADGFKSGVRLELGDDLSAADAIAGMKLVTGLIEAAGELGKAAGLNTKDDQERAAAGELVLEYLYVHNRLSKAGSAYGR